MAIFTVEFWISVFVFCIIFELSSPGLFYFIAPAIGSLASALFAWYDWGDFEQLMVFVSVSLAAFVLLQKYVRVPHKKEKHNALNAEGLIGKMGIVTVPTEGFIALVKIGSEVWRARTQDNMFLKQGDCVVVSDIVGATLLVVKTCC